MERSGYPDRTGFRVVGIHEIDAIDHPIERHPPAFVLERRVGRRHEPEHDVPARCSDLGGVQEDRSLVGPGIPELEHCES